MAGREIQFRLGGIHDGGLDLIFSEQGLAKLAARVTEALTQVREEQKAAPTSLSGRPGIQRTAV